MSARNRHQPWFRARLHPRYVEVLGGPCPSYPDNDQWRLDSLGCMPRITPEGTLEGAASPLFGWHPSVMREALTGWSGTVVLR